MGVLKVNIGTSASPNWVPVLGQVPVQLGSWESASTQSVPNNTMDKVTGWGADVYGGTHPFCTAPGAGGSPAGTITILEDGLYDINASVTFVSNAVGRRVAAIYVNEVEVRRVAFGTDTGGTAVVQVTHARPLSAGDTVNVYAYQESGAALNLSANPGHDFQIKKLP